MSTEGDGPLEMPTEVPTTEGVMVELDHKEERREVTKCERVKLPPRWGLEEVMNKDTGELAYVVLIGPSGYEIVAELKDAEERAWQAFGFTQEEWEVREKDHQAIESLRQFTPKCLADVSDRLVGLHHSFWDDEYDPADAILNAPKGR